MSTYDHYMNAADPTPRMRTKSGPFTASPLKSVAEAVAFCEELGLDPSDVRLAHNYVIWDAPETDEEVARRIQHNHDAAARHLAWVKRTHDEYVERGLLGGDER